MSHRLPMKRTLPDLTPRHLTCTVALLATLSACAAPDDGPPQPPPITQIPATQAAPPSGPNIRITPAQARAIGQKIWQNGCAGTVDGLTTWNKGEAFGSFGIGHFIWYPPGMEGPYDESFPPLLSFLQREGARPPLWLIRTRDSPWTSRDQFQAAFRSPQMNELREFLKNTVPGQTAFLVQRIESALPKMLAAAPPADRSRIQANFYKVGTTSNGVYALMDYVNFKGEGIKPTERYQGQGWGLLQFLQGMREVGTGQAAAREFSDSARRTLTRRVANAPKKRASGSPAGRTAATATPSHSADRSNPLIKRLSGVDSALMGSARSGGKTPFLYPWLKKLLSSFSSPTPSPRSTSEKSSSATRTPASRFAALK